MLTHDACCMLEMVHPSGFPEGHLVVSPDRERESGAGGFLKSSLTCPFPRGKLRASRRSMV